MIKVYRINVRVESWSGIVCDVLDVKAVSESAARMAAEEELMNRYEKSSLKELRILSIRKIA